MLGDILLLGRGGSLFATFDFEQFVLLTLPIWVQEMVFAARQIVIGFHLSVLASSSVQTAYDANNPS